MVLGRLASNFISKRNVENTPPHPKAAKAKITQHASLNAAARRRRARASGMPNRSAESMRARRTRSPPVVRLDFKPLTTPPPPSADVEMGEEHPEAQAPRTVTLPRRLARPAVREVDPAALVALEPELARIPPQYVRDRLREAGPAMMAVLAGTSVTSLATAHALPKEVVAVLRDTSADAPTHMFAVHARTAGPSATGARSRVTLFPAHAIVLAAHCANLPPLTASHPVLGEGATVVLPVVPLCVPAPSAFAPLAAFLYTRRADQLLATLLPPAPSSTPTPTLTPTPAAATAKDTKSRAARRVLGEKLAEAHGARALLAAAGGASSLWRNACALGVHDAALWAALDAAWDVLLIALARAAAAGRP